MATYNEVNDLVTATLFNDQKKRASNIDPTLLRNYPAARRLVKKSQVKEQGGKEIRFNVNVTGSNAAQSFGAFHTTTRTVSDHLKQGSMQLKNDKTDFSFDILEEEFNQGAYEIIDHIENREQQAMISLTKKIESDFWSFAASTDNLTPQGILYWLPYCSSAGFVGTAPSGYSTVAGIDYSVYTGWKSYGDQYVAVSEDDACLKMRTAFSKVDFEPPLDTMIVGDYNLGNQYGVYMNLSTIQQFENRAKDQNENLGPDVDSMNGRVMFRRTPLTQVAALDSNTRDPIIGINWGQLRNYVMSGWWMKRMKNPPASHQPLVVSVDVYCIHQTVMLDRRTGGFNISKA